MGTHPIFESDFDCLTEMEKPIRGHPIVEVEPIDNSDPFSIVPLVAEKVEAESVLKSKNFDSFILVGNFKNGKDLIALGASVADGLTKAASLDDQVFKLGGTFVNYNDKRIIISPTGPLNRCEDDVRRYFDAAGAGINRALKAGSRQPLLLVFPDQDMPRSTLVAVLGAMHALYTTLELREAVPAKALKTEKLGIWTSGTNKAEAIVKTASIIEQAKIICRDLQGSDPERMGPENFLKYCERLFQRENTDVYISSLSGAEMLKSQYPCLAAVDRACSTIDRHRARAIWLDYSDGKPERTIILIGKVLTYDTGGADVKAGGVMAGMHRDKGGASAVAGFMHAINILKPKNVRILGGMAVCRNSIGSEAYVADEIITARSGKRVRIGNTDAEGRMAMVDLLCRAKERCISEKWKNPEFYTIATLTGHAKIAHGPYTGIVANGPYRKEKRDSALKETGEEIGDPFELGTLRREDIEFHTGKDEQSDVLQCNNLPSTRTPRGHQGPAAFLILASGMRDHGLGSENPFKYCHLDIAGSAGPFPGFPTGAPITALLDFYNFI